MIYYIEQNGRYTRDFMYMFKDEIDIAGYIFLETLMLDGKEGVYLSEVKEEICLDQEKRIIVCRNPEKCSKNEIEELGIQYGKDWIYAADLFKILDKKQIDIYTKGRQLILWGSGKRASVLFNKFPFLKINMIVDINEEKQGKQMRGKKIENPIKLQKIVEKEKYYILVAAPYLEVKEKLEKWGWEEGKQFVDIENFSVRPSDLIKQIIDAPVLTSWQCHYPFEHIRVFTDGKYTFCSFMDSGKIDLGNILYFDYEDYEHSVMLKLARLSVLNGTYVFCDSTKCSQIRKLYSNKNELKENNMYPVLTADQFFKAASVDIDSSCNLYCCSCRNKVIINRGTKQQKVTDRVIEQLLPNIDILFLAGAGEVFLSPYYKQILYAKTFKHLKGIMVLSNANICDKEEWDHIISMVDGNVEVSFSIDAGTKKTYEKIRRGGNFDKVEEHIRYVCKLKKEKRIKRVILNFVIQRDNYNELELFVLWGKSLGVDYFNITFLDNWGTWSDEEFKKICMYEKEKEPLPELQTELNKLKKYGDCILLDEAIRYREMNYSLLLGK